MQPLDAVYLQILKIYARICPNRSRLMVWIRPPYTVWPKNTVRFRFFCHI